MNINRNFRNIALISSSLIGVSLLGFAGRATAEPSTLVTCGPNGAAYVVAVVPAGCRHLTATSAPRHSPDNTVQQARLGFTFSASAPQSVKQVALQSQPDRVALELRN
uniref:hypothetical protein n=1 Tax=Petrachloros mirabilis TaxID=2918835 RepID=UPI001EE7E50D|nr:hypothetical protein [Petrachloros mirabilis]